MNEQQKHREEITNTRVGGFGGSDAKIFAKIADLGIERLSNTEKKRIRVAKGIDPPPTIPENEAMAAGHFYEDYCQENYYSKITREAKITTVGVADNFLVFAHADFYDQKRNEVVECKFSTFETEKVKELYKYQLQWYYLLGVNQVFLQHGDGVKFPFEVEKEKCVPIDIDFEMNATLLQGIQILDELWNSKELEGLLTMNEEVDAGDLLPFEQEKIEKFLKVVNEIERLEERKNQLRGEIKEMMESNSLFKINDEKYSVTYVPDSIRKSFDEKLLSKDYPDIDLNLYKKESKIKSSIRINIKKQKNEN